MDENNIIETPETPEIPESVSPEEALGLLDKIHSEPAPADEAPVAEEKPAEAAPAPVPAAKAPVELADDAMIKIIVNGEEQLVPYGSIKNGVMMQADYSRKMKEIADGRKELSAEQLRVAEERRIARDVLPYHFRELLDKKAKIDAIDMEQLFAEDQEMYHKLVAAEKEVTKDLQRTAEEMKKIDAEMANARVQHLQQVLAVEQEKLRTVIPDFGETHQKELVEFGRACGFSDNELNEVYDHRMVAVLHKAAQYDKLMKQQSVASKKLEKAPPRVLSPTNTTTEDKPAEKIVSRARQSGDPNDVLAALAALRGE